MERSNLTDQRLEAALSRLSHAYIVLASPDEGSLELVKRLTAAYVCTGSGKRPCGECSGCRKAMGDIHPDIISLGVPEGKRNITVEQVRQLRAQAYIRPNEAPRKVFVIRDAQAMNDSAQNALLKVLEDGPGYLAFLLVTEQPQQLLPTIRSRCETLDLTGRTQTQDVELDEELRGAAEELARRLTNGNERALAEYTAELEQRKWDKDTLLAFFRTLETALQPELLRNPKKILPLMEQIKQLQQAALFNVGTGHLFGWLTVFGGRL